VAPFSFSNFGKSGPLNREGDFVQLAYSTRNPIEYAIPKLLYEDGGLLDVPREDAPAVGDTRRIARLMNIWSTDWVYRSSQEDSAFSFLRFLDVSPSEVHSVYTSHLFETLLRASEREHSKLEDDTYATDNAFVANVTAGPFRLPSRVPDSKTVDELGLTALRSISSAAWQSSCLSRRDLKWFIPPAVAPPISIYCADRNFVERQATLRESTIDSLALYGLPPSMWVSQDACAEYQQRFSGVHVSGLIGRSPQDQLPPSAMQVPEAKRLIYDSAKLARLDALLHELKAGDHRVLVYFQMTRMMDLMEEYLIYRQYKYLRLDGSSKLEDRRDMVMEWQTRPDIFVFLLSTRAGGLGINLTAADTVVFYDHDWNPSNDAQAMDRAHRLGQTRQVTVYRLITKGTIDERIVQLARVKKDVQDIVVGNKTFTDVTKPSEIVQLLLTEDQLANLETTEPSTKSKGKKRADAVQADAGRDLWNDEGDEFFGQSASGQAGNVGDGVDDDSGTPIPTTGRGRKRGGGTGASRGRRSGTRGRGRGKGAMATGDGNS